MALRGVRLGGSDFLHIALQSPLSVCYAFAAVFNLIFDSPNFGGRGAPRGSMMVP